MNEDALLWKLPAEQIDVRAKHQLPSHEDVIHGLEERRIVVVGEETAKQRWHHANSGDLRVSNPFGEVMESLP